MAKKKPPAPMIKKPVKKAAPKKKCSCGMKDKDKDGY